MWKVSTMAPLFRTLPQGPEVRYSPQVHPSPSGPAPARLKRFVFSAHAFVSKQWRCSVHLSRGGGLLQGSGVCGLMSLDWVRPQLKRFVVRSPFRAKHHVVVQYSKVDEMSPAPLAWTPLPPAQTPWPGPPPADLCLYV